MSVALLHIIKILTFKKMIITAVNLKALFTPEKTFFNNI